MGEGRDGQFHAPVILPLGKYLPVSIKDKASWATDMVWKLDIQPRA